MKVLGTGSIPARIMIVADAPSDSDVRTCTPFSGGSGHELNRLLHEAGIMGSECYITFVSKRMAPEGMTSRLVATKKNEIGPAHVKLHSMYVLPSAAEGYAELLTEIEMVRPNVIVAMGNLALFALTGQWSVAKWRGSLLRALPFGRMQTEDELPKVIPTYHPSQIFKQFELRAVVLSDLRRVKRHMASRQYSKPAWKFCVRPSYAQTISILNSLTIDCDAALCDPVWLDFDIETRGKGHVYIDCIGISWSRTEAICIPFMARGNHEGYWNAEEEADIVYRLYKLLTHKNVRIRWQNGLFDAQIVHYNWHFIPRGGQDTMISQHSAFCALPKALDFLASLYAEWYVYWKDEGKVASDLPEEQRWVYNLQDCIYTRESGEVLSATIKQMNLEAVDENQQALFAPVLRAMLTGVRIIPEARAKMAMDIQEELSKREAFLYNLLGHTINVSSPKQMTTLFYDDLKQPLINKRTFVNGHVKLSPTCDDEALQKIAAKEPILKPLTNCIADIRTLHKFLGDFVMMPTDLDGRMRCSFNIAGDAAGKSAPYSYRLSSSKNPFGNGGNLQTIPSKNSKSSGKAAARGSLDQPLPNIKTMYGPDAGFTFFDMDLDRADLQVVVWESDDAMLKAALRMGADIHLLNTYGIDNKEPPALEELVETHPKYAEHRGPRKYKREFAKVFCHACVTAGHEVLTREGWWPVEHFIEGTEIAVWNKTTQEITFEIPSAFNRDIARAGEILVSFEGQAFSQEVTSDHRMPYSTTDTKTFSVTQAAQLPSTAKIPTAGYYSGSRSVDEAAIRLLAAFQADGTYDYKYRTRWHLKKQRKIDRLLWLLKEMNLTPSISKGWNGAFSIFAYWRPVDWMKVPGSWLLELDGQALDWWLDELKYWDGHQGTTGAIHISTSRPEAAEWINTIALLRGKGSRCYVHTQAEGNRKANWHVSLNNRTLAGTESMRVTNIPLTIDTPVYCPTTSTGFFMVRRNGKISVTGNTNYLGKANTVAAHTGRGVHEIDQAQKRWFAAHPGILRWHERTKEQVTKHRFVENKFGYRWYIFDRIDELLLPAAVAWIPQSTVGIVINKVWRRFYETLPEVQVLLQVHDSLAGQFPTHRRDYLLPKMEEASRIVIPYDDPLIIPTGVKTSTISWGDCK